MTRENDEQAILGQECRALDQWASGNPLGYVDIDADDVTYFDDIGAHSRIDGLDKLRTYLTGLVGKICCRLLGSGRLWPVASGLELA
jgi:hypothetical protein